MHGLSSRTAAWRVLHDIRREVPFDLALERALAALPESERGVRGFGSSRA